MPLEFLKARKDILVPIGLLIISLGLLAYNSIVGSGSRINPLSRLVLTLISYPQRVVDGAVDTVADTWYRYGSLRTALEDNEALRQRTDGLEWQLQQLVEENARLRMSMVPTAKIWPGAELMHAQIIALSTQEEYRIAVINRGSISGVRYGMPVVTGAGTVGKIIGSSGSRTMQPTGETAPREVPQTSATVLMLIDPRCRVDARVYRFISTESVPEEETTGLDPACPWNPVNWQQTRTRGVAQGDYDKLILKFVDRNADIQPGDLVVSSGIGGIFPKGLRLGKVSRVIAPKVGLSPYVEVTPAVDFDSLEEVQVMIIKGAPAP